MSANDLPASAETESKPVTRIAWEIDELEETGHGCRAAIYTEIAEGRLIARKRRGRTVILEADRAAWVAAWPRAVIKPNARRAKAAEAA
jgi:hypothetical protein